MSNSSMKFPVPKRIMILRLSAVGDTILSMPILCELRRRFPSSKIAWVVGQGAADVLRGHEDLDDLLVLSKKDSASPLAYLRFLNKVRKWRPDTLIDAQGLTKSASIGSYSGAKLRIGLSKSEFEGRELSTWLNNTLVTPNHKQVVLRGLELLKPLGIEDPQIQFKVPRCRATIQSVDQKLVELKASGNWGIINVGAGWPSKIWPTDRYAAIAKHLGQRWLGQNDATDKSYRTCRVGAKG
ncbi:MAG: glycosyltransferase family 9 protein [Pirellula sp.]